jgi:hypothetical protein
MNQPQAENQAGADPKTKGPEPKGNDRTSRDPINGVENWSGCRAGIFRRHHGQAISSRCSTWLALRSLCGLVVEHESMPMAAHTLRGEREPTRILWGRGIAGNFKTDCNAKQIMLALRAFELRIEKRRGFVAGMDTRGMLTRIVRQESWRG